MSPLPSRSRKPRTPVGKAIRAWPWLLRWLTVLRLFRRARPFLRVGLALAVVVAILRRLQRRRTDDRLRVSAPPTGAGWSGGTRETGAAAGPGTTTERNLEVQKSGDESPPASS